jgi:hypothetical protein
VKRKADADRLPDAHRTAAEIRRSGDPRANTTRRGAAAPQEPRTFPFPAKHEPPAFCAAASACDMDGCARSEYDNRMRSERMQNSSSPLMARMPHIEPSNSDHWKRDAFAGCAYVTRCANSPCNHLKNQNRPWPHLAAFYPAIGRSCMQHSVPPTQRTARVRQTAISGTACRGCGSTIKLPSERRYCAVESVWRRTRKDPSVAI